jgi:uncharacterized protein YydD (DUF2326 family)
MINAVRCNHPSFKQVSFEENFNVVLAERTKESTKKDSRNGLGKTTLIEIIHFCLGADAKKRSGLIVETLEEWSFSLDLTLNGNSVIVTRSVKSPSKVVLEGNTSNFPIKPKREKGLLVLSVKDWNAVLGNLMFGLPIGGENRKAKPSFRSLISYFIRREKDGFSIPFEHHRKQLEWDKQVNNAFLLGLAWEDASDLHALKEKQKLLDSIKKAAQSGVITDVLGSLGELEAMKVRLEARVREEAENLNNFRVHSQYSELEQRANLLTEEFHQAANANVMDEQMLSFYVSSLEEENEPSSNDIAQIYARVAIELPGLVRRRLEEVELFHHQIVENRRQFLSAEIERLRRNITLRQELMRNKTEERASILQILRSHGALEEYTLLQQLHLGNVASLNELNKQIESLKKFEEGKRALKVERDLLQQRALHDYNERRVQRERAIALFNANSEALYNAPGNLVIDVGNNGFQFKVEIERSGSQGVSNMKIFCYDLMLAQLWSQNERSPRILIHDSKIFDGVDERQIAIALQLAKREAERCNFQYICCLNSDLVPWSEFDQGFDLRNHVRLELSDAQIGGSLLGVRFESSLSTNRSSS